MKLEGERRKVKELLERGMSYSDIARLLGMHRHTVYFAIEKCREMQLKMQRFATHLIPFRQCVGQSIALAMKRDDMGVMN